MRLTLISWLIIPAVLTSFVFSYFVKGIRETFGSDENIDLVSPKVEFDKTVIREKLVSGFEWNGEGVVTLMFDDAWLSQYEVAYPILNSRNIKASLAVPTDSIGEKNYMGWWHVEKLQYDGWEITSHTRSHTCEGEFDSYRLAFEYLGSKIDLEGHKLYVENFVAPCGVITPETLEAVKKYYLSLRTSENGQNPIPVKNPYNIKTEVLNNLTTLDAVKKMISKAKTERAWLILAFHQIDSSGTKYAVTPELFTQIVDEVEKSGLQIALPIQVLTSSLH